MITKAINHIQHENGKKVEQNSQHYKSQNGKKKKDIKHQKSNKNKSNNHKKQESFKENPDVLKEGYLGKESVHLKKVRKRWMVLKGTHLYSYKEMQTYEDPTEVFDLKLYRTAKMCRNGKLGQFELISMKQERRVFIASSKNEMNEWIHRIKKVILFSKPFNYKCRTIRSCVSLKRIKDVLKLYQYYTGYNDSIIKHIKSYKQLINDYHHVLEFHLNEDGENCKNSNKSMELIQKQLNFYCNINQCRFYLRQQRIREEDENEYKSPYHQQMAQTQNGFNQYGQELNVYRDILDTMHCSLIHAFDNGLRIKHKALQLIVSPDDDDEDDQDTIESQCNLSFDHELMELKSYLTFNKKRLIKARGTKRFQHNKFYLNITR